MIAGECVDCFGYVDEDGATTSECAARGMPAQCETCGACICDGSC